MHAFGILQISLFMTHVYLKVSFKSLDHFEVTFVPWLVLQLKTHMVGNGPIFEGFSLPLAVM